MMRIATGELAVLAHDNPRRADERRTWIDLVEKARGDVVVHYDTPLRATTGGRPAPGKVLEPRWDFVYAEVFGGLDFDFDNGNLDTGLRRGLGAVSADLAVAEFTVIGA